MNRVQLSRWKVGVAGWWSSASLSEVFMNVIVALRDSKGDSGVAETRSSFPTK